MGKFIVKSVALPVFLAVLSSYIYDTIIKPEKESPKIYIKDSNNESPKKHMETPEVKFNITVVDSNNVAKEFDYEGPADQVEQVSESIRKFWENE